MSEYIRDNEWTEGSWREFDAETKKTFQFTLYLTDPSRVLLVQKLMRRGESPKYSQPMEKQDIAVEARQLNANSLARSIFLTCFYYSQSIGRLLASSLMHNRYVHFNAAFQTPSMNAKK